MMMSILRILAVYLLITFQFWLLRSTLTFVSTSNNLQDDSLTQLNNLGRPSDGTSLRKIFSRFVRSIENSKFNKRSSHEGYKRRQFIEISRNNVVIQETQRSNEFVDLSSTEFDHLPDESSRFERSKRASGSGRGKPNRQLAKVPPKTTTTTTSTSTSTTTTSEPITTVSETSANEYSADSPIMSEDDEYEETGESDVESTKKSGESKSTKVKEAGGKKPEKTSSTTPDPNCESSTKKTAKSSKSKGKSKQQEVTSTTTEQVIEYEEEEETTTTAAPVGSKKKPSKSTKKPVINKDAGTSSKEEPPSASTKPSTEVSISNETQSNVVLPKKKPLVRLPFIKPKNASVCTSEAYLEFPKDLIGNKWRSRGLVIVHICVACYMFYSLAVVCERYFMPALEEFSQRLQLSEDVAGATLMSAGSSAPELFAALLGVFVAKGDVGTGTIVGSAVFNILFVIGICAFVSTTTAKLSWWPVLRDSVFYTFTVLVLILFIYDERITAYESSSMIALYGVYILIMANNDAIRTYVTKALLSNTITANLISAGVTADASDDEFGTQLKQVKDATSRVEEDAMYLAALLVIVKHRRLFRCNLRFQSAGRYIIVKSQHKKQLLLHNNVKQTDEVNYFGPENEPLNSDQRSRMEAYASSKSMSKTKFSIVSKTDYELWNKPPEEGENYYLWLAKVPVNYVLHYTIPDCTIYPDKYIIAFLISILWTAFFSYVMVWMVTLIGYTFGIPDSVMGVTFLAAGTSVPDCYSSIHAARRGMADMAVSNSIGSNVFDILIGLSIPWFIQSAIYPGVVATINSRGVIYSVILLFVSLIVTIYLLNKYEWNLKPRLGLALLIAYGLFIVLTCMLEFNLFGHVNPPPCPVPFS